MKPSNKPTHFVQFGETDLYKPTRSNKSDLSQQIKDIVDEAYNANLDSEKITKAPVGASGVITGSSKNYKDIIALAEQRGYERGLVEAHKNDPTGSELDDLLTRTEQEGYDRAKRELSVKYGGQG